MAVIGVPSAARLLVATALVATALVVTAGPAHAQDYRFPAGDEHYGAFYPTAYMDEGGADWNCGSIYYAGHDGSDYGVGSWAGMDEGRRVVAAAEGTVVATNDGEYDRCDSGACGEGNYVIIEHANGRRTWYWHLKQWTVAVSAGQYVACGTHLAYVGSSGNSTGPHLHFEVREPGNYPGDPFDGPCSAPPTYWIAQGDYGGLPGNTCPSTGPCTQVATLSCGQTIATANNAGGSTSSHGVYGCGDGPWSGSEIAFAFSTPVGEPVTIGLTGAGADVDLFLLASDACDGSGALTCSTNSDASDESVAFDAAAGAVYTVVIDGWEGAVSGFGLTAYCNGAPGGDTDPPDPEDTAPSDSGVPDGDDDAPRVKPGVPGARVPLAELGCGCASPGGAGSGGAGWGGALVAVALLSGVRRRR